MIILSVDYGDVRTGIACSDPLEMLASPVTVITETYQKNLIEKIAVIAKEKRAEKIVVGYPKNMDGTEGFRAKNCAEFANLLQEKTGLETVLFDERLTTVSAHKALNMTDIKGKKRKEVVDALSAVMILEDYIKSSKN